MLIDTFNRKHDYLRISLTDVCNLRCSYCMPEDEYAFLPAEKTMKEEEIVQIAALFVTLGVTKIRLTGGEPLVRKDAPAIIRRLAALPVSLSLTTNATRLHTCMDALTEAGIQSINISLDTLDRNRFQLLTKRDRFNTVRQNIDLLLQRGIEPKINMVVMKGVNDQEIPDFIEWTKADPVHVRFIEFMPFSGNHWQKENVLTYKDILTKIEDIYTVVPLGRGANETASKFQIPGHKGSFAVISTMSAPFCGDCNRIRLTADGKLKNCLFSASETDILTPFRNGADIVPLIRETILAKKKELGGQFTAELDRVDADHIQNRTMISIGG
jgi:cyclic pyranopterin phosphate synthase